MPLNCWHVFQDLLPEFVLLPISWQFCMLRWWCNGILTTHRLGQVVVSCHFCGLFEGDCIRHYVRCAAFWVPILQACGLQIAFVELEIPDLIGLSDRLGPGRFRVPVTAALALNKAHFGAPPADAVQSAHLLALAGRVQRPVA